MIYLHEIITWYLHSGGILLFFTNRNLCQLCSTSISHNEARVIFIKSNLVILLLRDFQCPFIVLMKSQMLHMTHRALCDLPLPPSPASSSGTHPEAVDTLPSFSSSRCHVLYPLRAFIRVNLSF